MYVAKNNTFIYSVEATTDHQMRGRVHFRRENPMMSEGLRVRHINISK